MCDLENFAIVIVTYNGGKYLERCLSSCVNVVRREMIFVVDNNSTDNTKELIQRHGVNATYLRKNVGFGAANNIGISLALNNPETKYVLLLNQDAYLSNTSLQRYFSLPALVKEHLVAFLQLNGTGDRFDYNFRKIYLTEQNCPEFLEDVYFNRTKQYYEAKFINAAAWVVPRNMFTTIGGFNPFFFHYGEDDNFVDRVFFHGGKLYLAPQCIVWHDRFERKRASSPFFVEKKITERRLRLEISNPANSRSTLEYFRYALFGVVKDLISLKHISYQNILLIKLLMKRELHLGIKLRKKSTIRDEGVFLNVDATPNDK